MNGEPPTARSGPVRRIRRPSAGPGTRTAGGVEEALTSVWRQALRDRRTDVVLENGRYPVASTRLKHLRTVAFSYRGLKFFGIEQNPRTRSRWAALARGGKRIMQFNYGGRYVANVCDGKLFRYPAWRAMRLPASPRDRGGGGRGQGGGARRPGGQPTQSRH